MLDKLLATAALAAAGYGLYRTMNSVGRRIDLDFRGLVLADAATWLAGRLPAPPAQIESELNELVQGRPGSPLLAPLMRLECEILRAGAPTRREVRTHVWLKQPDGVKAATVTRILGDSEIPSEAHEHFLRTGQDRMVWCLFDRAAHAGVAH